MPLKDTFSGLDNLILDQPNFIDLDEKEETDEEIKDTLIESNKVKTPEDKTKGKTKIDKDDLLEIETDDNVVDLDKDKTKSKKEDSKDESPEEVLKAWGDYFKDNSILAEDDLEGFDGTAETLQKAFEKREIRVGLEMVDDYKAQLPTMLKYLADNWEDGVPLTELLNIKSNQIKYSNVTDEKLEESIDTQKAIYAEYLRKTTKYSDTKIEKEIARLVDLDELKDESKEGLVELKKFEAEAEETIKRETKKQKELRLEENKQQIKQYEKISKETKEVIPGIKIDDKLQADILNKVINPVGIDGNGNPVSYIQSLRNEDPYSFDIKLNYLMTLTKGLKDFSKITNTITTKATQDLSKIINTSAPKSNKDAIDTSDKKSLIDYLKMPQNKNK